MSDKLKTINRKFKFVYTFFFVFREQHDEKSTIRLYFQKRFFNFVTKKGILFQKLFKNAETNASSNETIQPVDNDKKNIFDLRFF